MRFISWFWQVVPGLALSCFTASIHADQSIAHQFDEKILGRVVCTRFDYQPEMPDAFLEATENKRFIQEVESDAEDFLQTDARTHKNSFLTQVSTSCCKRPKQGPPGPPGDPGPPGKTGERGAAG